MAIFLLGALVTEIVGSIGGTTFKRQRSSRVMMRKSNGASRSKLLQNPRLVFNSLIFKKWRNLSLQVQTAWNTIASANSVLNKFGQSVFLTGVSFQRKMDLQVNFLGEIPDPEDWSPDISPIVFDGNPVLNWDFSTFDVTFNSDECNEAYVALMIEYSLQPLNAPQFISRGVFYNGLFNMGSSVDVYDEFFSYYGIYENLYNFRMYAYVYTPSGIVGTMFQSDVTEQFL
jgi:hypothetical protein